MRPLLLLLTLVPTLALNQTNRFDDEFSTVHVERNRVYDVQHYGLHITLDHPGKKISGDVTIRLKPLNEGLTRVVLDSAELQINRVEANGLSLDYSLLGEKLNIELGRPYNSSDELTIKVMYEGHPRKGLYWVGPDQAYPNKPAQIWSQSEDQDAHYWFPCYDFPNDKATAEMVITVRKPFMAISNGQLLEVEDRGDLRTFYWKMDTPYSTYLTSVAVGDFEEYRDKAGDVPIEYYVPRGTGREKALRSFGRTPDMLRFFSQRIGINYPYKKYAQVAVADFIFGGMENITASTQTATALHDERAHQDYKSENLVAHELAHQWWGDLVTIADWSHLWLNEGFATYFDALYTQKWLGNDEFRLQMYNDAATYFQEDAGQYRRPIVSRLYTDSNDLFDAHTYEKGSLVLDMIHYILGDDLFFKALKHYGTKFAVKNVGTDDLRDAIQEATGKNLDRFFQQWLYHSGHPEYDVAWAWENNTARVKVRQTQKVDDRTPLFEMPVVIDFTLPGGKVEKFVVQIDGAEQAFTFPLPARPSLVRFDPGNFILKKLNFKKDKDELLFQVANDPDVIGRMRAADDLSNLADDRAVFNALATALKVDSVFGVRAAAASAMTKVNSAGARDALIQATRDRDSRVRKAAVAALGKFQRDPKAIAAIIGLLESDSSYAAQASAARALKDTKADKAFEILMAALSQDSHNDVVRRNVLTALADVGVPEQVRPVMLEWTRYGKNNGTRSVAISLLPKVSRGAEKEVTERLIALLEDPWIYSRESAILALGEMRATEAIDELQVRMLTETDSRLRKEARESIARIRGGK